ncbi:MAG: transketolase [Rhodospirillaceae bacterium]|nr:transketolase [Rhodospirillaceae bacterium]
MSSAPKPEVRSSNFFDADAARRRCLGFRRRILAVSQQVQALHVAPAFSCMEITDAAYHGLIRRAGAPSDDTFLMSKGHGCLAQYVILEALGVLSSDDLAAYCTPGGRLGAHPDYGTPGIEASTGSLGHGMGMAVGMSYGDRLLGADRTVYAVFSDGEFQEGSTWEAMMMAANLKLDRLVAFLDLNDFQGLGRTSESHPAFYPVLDKARAFGWEAVEVNGHDGLAIVEAVRGREASDRPLLVVCRTVKGKGVSYMENVPIWHYRSPSPEEYRQALAELQEISG